MKPLSVTSPTPLAPWKVAHGLGKLPTVVIPSMKCGGAIWWTNADKTYVYLMASDAGLAGVIYVE